MFDTSAQSQETLSVDSLLKTSVAYTKSYQDIKALEYAKRAYSLAKGCRNKENIAEACSRMAIAAVVMGLYDISLEYVREGERFCGDYNYYLKAELLATKSASLSYLSFSDKALEYNHAALKNIGQVKSNDLKTKELLLSIYQNIGTIYYQKGNEDSLAMYQKMSDDLFSGISPSEYKMLRSETVSAYFYNKTEGLMEKKKEDSAFLLFNKVYEIKKSLNDPVLHMEYYSFGNYFNQRGEYSKALDYYLNTIRNMEENNIMQIEFAEIYQEISKLYEVLGNPGKEKEYLKKYLKKKEEITSRQKKNTDYALKVILKDENEKQTYHHARIIILISVLVFLIIVVFVVFHRKNQKKKEQAVLDPQQREETVVQLSRKVNEAFEEIIQLARDNDPHFWTRFQEVYPRFRERLLTLNPRLRVTELTFCAYIYLGFSTKEIAYYTFKVEKTVRNNRYNLRKRLGIASEDDMGVWLMEYING